MRHHRVRNKASLGAYYIVRLPRRWTVFAFLESDFGEIGHSEIWEKHLAEIVAREYAQHTGIRATTLRDLIGNSVYGFPRGRVIRKNRQFIIWHGNDWQSFVAPSKIEKAFFLKSPIWHFDEHETMIPEDKIFLRQILLK